MTEKEIKFKNIFTSVDLQWAMLRNKATLTLWPKLTDVFVDKFVFPFLPVLSECNIKGLDRDTINLGHP